MSEDPQPPKPDPRDSDDQRQSREWSRLGSLAFEFVAYLAVLGYVGWWLDQRFGWHQRGLLGGLLLAMIAWVYRVLRRTRNLFK